MKGGFLKKSIENAKFQLNKTYNDKLFLLSIFFIILIFASLSYYLYNKFIKNKLNSHVLNKEFINQKDDDPSVYIMFFYTTWCPHCKKAKPEIDKFESYLKTLNISHDDKFKLLRIDCDKDTTSAEKFNIKGYPTIKLMYKGNVVDYDAKPNVETLKQFINEYTIT